MHCNARRSWFAPKMCGCQQLGSIQDGSRSHCKHTAAQFVYESLTATTFAALTRFSLNKTKNSHKRAHSDSIELHSEEREKLKLGPLGSLSWFPVILSGVYGESRAANLYFSCLTCWVTSNFKVSKILACHVTWQWNVRMGEHKVIVRGIKKV